MKVSLENIVESGYNVIIPDNLGKFHEIAISFVNSLSYHGLRKLSGELDNAILAYRRLEKTAASNSNPARKGAQEVLNNLHRNYFRLLHYSANPVVFTTRLFFAIFAASTALLYLVNYRDPDERTVPAAPGMIWLGFGALFGMAAGLYVVAESYYGIQHRELNEPKLTALKIMINARLEAVEVVRSMVEGIQVLEDKSVLDPNEFLRDFPAEGEVDGYSFVLEYEKTNNIFQKLGYITTPTDAKIPVSSRHSPGIAAFVSKGRILPLGVSPATASSQTSRRPSAMHFAAASNSAHNHNRPPRSSIIEHFESDTPTRL